MFASQKKETIRVDGVDVVIRKLSGRSLEKASEARQISVAAVSSRLGPEMIRAFTERGNEEKAEPDFAAKTKARFASYDRDCVLTAGIVSWSAPERLEAGIADLDEESAQILHEAILTLSLPPIDPAVAEEQEKNG